MGFFKEATTELHTIAMQPGISVRLFCIGYLLLNTYALIVQSNPSRLQHSVLPDWPFSVENQYPLAGDGEGGEDLNWRGDRLSDNGLCDKVKWLVVVFSYYKYLFYLTEAQKC